VSDTDRAPSSNTASDEDREARDDKIELAKARLDGSPEATTGSTDRPDEPRRPWWQRHLEPGERQRIMGELGIKRQAHWAFRFSTMLALSVVVAVMGLSADSAAVVIGAMLLAPLMQPVLAVAACISMALFRLALRSAGHVVLATEGWTPRLAGHERAIAPVYSLMVATEPLTEEQWARVGLAEREVFSDHGHVVIYGQRTHDDRIAFGGRGAPYHWGSSIRPEFDHDERVFTALHDTLTGLLPQLGGVRFTHAWGGPLGIARDWHPAVTYDRTTRTGRAGGYVGDGVAATNLAGRTLADLVLDRHTARTELPWVGHRSPRWEREPLRWLGINAGLRLADLAEREEARTARPARLGSLLDRLTSH